MTLQELLETARATLSRLGDRPLDYIGDGQAHALATGILEMLGADTVPCGWESPSGLPNCGIRVNGDGTEEQIRLVRFPDQWGGAAATPDDARVLFGIGLRACDEAER